MKTKSMAIIGLTAWLLWFFQAWPFSPYELTHVQFLILAAPLFLVPLGWRMAAVPNLLIQLALPASLLLTGSYLLEQSLLAAILSIPWLVLSLIVALRKWSELKSVIWTSVASRCQLAAFLYLPIGAAWAFADRLGFQPMGFSPAIVLLTVAHFHYAGFMLPLLSAWVVQLHPGNWLKIAVHGVIFGVPLTAIGITATQYNLPHWIELTAVTLMAGTALSLGAAQVYLGIRIRANRMIAGLWILSGLAIMIGMSLALGYGWRMVLPIPLLTIPWMHAVHGTLNAIGFAMPGLLGWYFYQKNKTDSIQQETKTSY